MTITTFSYKELPPIISEYDYETKTVVQTETITVPSPANTRLAAFPTPEAASSTSTSGSPRTTAVEIIADDDHRKPRTIVRGPPRVPIGWFGNW